MVLKTRPWTLYILVEPTTGLHFEDVPKLLDVLHALVEAGNSVLVIERNLEVIRTADWILDLGPKGGEEGARIVAEGTPEQVAVTEGRQSGASSHRCSCAARPRGAGRSARNSPRTGLAAVAPACYPKR
jgi:excinuclease UvrABC ATPase subunit